MALPVVKDFVAAVKAKAVGEEVIGSLTPGQALVGVVHRELTELMGGASAELNLAAERGAFEWDAPVARYWPAFAQAGKGAMHTDQAVAYVDRVLALNPDARVVAILIGSNDWDPVAYRRDLTLIVRKVKAAGKIAMVARIPYRSDIRDQDFPERLSRVVDEVSRAHGLLPGRARDELARHSLDFWLTGEDLPRPENRVTVDRDRDVLFLPLFTLSVESSTGAPSLITIRMRRCSGRGSRRL